MNKDNFKGKYKGPDPKKVVETISELTPQIVSAVEHSVIPADDGLIYGNWAERFVRIHGDLKTKIELTRGTLVMEAIHFSQRNKLKSLKVLCQHTENFEASVRYKSEYTPNITESLCRVYEITAGCIIKNAVDAKDYAEAKAYLKKCLSIINNLKKEYSGYTPNKELITGIESKLNIISKHLQ